MTFGEKLKNARLSLNLSQFELAEKVGITEKSVYNYEHGITFPQQPTLKKLANILNVSVGYLTIEEEVDPQKNISREAFLANVKNKFGHKGVREAADVLEKAAALFAGGELDEDAKEIFFQSLMEVYVDSKTKASKKFSPKKRVSRKKTAKAVMAE